MERRLLALIVTVLLVQGFVRYWGQVDPALRFGSFFYATAGVRLLVPLAVLLALGVSWRQLGFGRPRVPRSREAARLFAGFVVVTVLALVLMQLEAYRSAYSGVRVGDLGSRLQRFAAFALSTTIPWEILHRGYLLHGVRELCTRGGIDTNRSATLAIAFTLCFEVLFHLTKPALEALALVVGSPVLSWLAFRYRSIWIPLLIHVWIEGLWFVAIWL